MEIKIKLTIPDKLTDRMKNATLKCAALALNRAATTGKAAVAQEVRKEYTMPARDLKGEVKVEKANMRYLKAKIIIGRRVISLVKFRSKGGQRYKSGKVNPVQVMVKRSHGYKPLRKAFKATMKYGESFFVRVGKGRGDVKALYGPSMGGMVKDAVVTGNVLKRVKERFNNEFRQALKHAMGKGRIKVDLPGE